MQANIVYGLRVLGIWLIGVAFSCLSAMYATIATALIMRGIIYLLGMTDSWSWMHWVIWSPPIYVLWLGAFLIGCAIDLQAWRLLFGYRKHRRVTTSNGLADEFQFYLMLFNYTRQKIVWNLPLTRVYQGFAGVRWLVLLSGAIRASVGRRSLLFGFLYDPDLTELGDDVILGDGCIVTAHSMTTNPDGSRVFVTVPVKIGSRTVIGGQARVDLGVRIGADALVEPLSYVAPFTVIGNGEVWGGNPARFIRVRDLGPQSGGRTSKFVFGEPMDQQRHAPDGEPKSRPVCSPQPQRRFEDLAPPHTQETDELDLALRELVAHALHRPIEAITPNLSADTCAAWDSLGQLGLAAGLQRQFGLSLSPQESFQLRSMSDLRRLVADAQSRQQRRAA